MKECPVCKRDIEEKKIGIYKCLCGYTEITANAKKETEHDGKEFLLKLIDEMLDREDKVLNNRLEIDPGFIAVRMKNKNFIIRVEED